MASFLAIARLGGFRAAAREREISQGAISQQLQKLETQLGARLIERDSTGCRLTPEGKEFQPSAENLLKLSVNALGAFRGKQITVGASSNIGIYLLWPFVKAYRDGCEGRGTLGVQIHQNPALAQKLAAGDIDVAAMEWWDGRPGYDARLWRRDDLVIIVPPTHSWAGLRRLPRALLKDVPLLGGEPGTGTGRVLARYLADEALAPTIGTQLGSTDAVKQWVKAGLGVSLVLRSTVTEETKAGTLVAVPLDHGGLQKELYVIWRDTLSADHPARKFGIWLASCPSESRLGIDSRQSTITSADTVRVTAGDLV